MAPGHSLALARRFRLQWEESQQAWVLLFPEGMIILNNSAAEILKRCDGLHDGVTLIAELQRVFPGEDLTAQAVEFLNVAHARGWITHD